MRVSLIMATIRRTNEVEKFLHFLSKQTYRDFELIVVDQNEDNRLVPILQTYEDEFPIIHLHSDKGISKSRNKGLSYCTGDLVAFPDDDCWYEPNLLEKVVGLFHASPGLDIVTGRSVDEFGKDTTAKFDKSEGYVNRNNVWRRAVSYTIFHKTEVANQIGCFDEEIGMGANSIYLSGEETDYILRALTSYTIYYFPQLIVKHPNPIARYTPQVIDRAYKYGCGFGKVVTKHHFSFRFKTISLLKPFVAMLIFGASLQIPKSNYYWHSLRGRIRGMR
jgi:glycosyltransferase involved in cell wall biosynthesis